MQSLLLLYVALFGMALGSFLALVVVRLPKRESIVSPRSHCRSCGQPLKWYDNIPILSYLWLKGKCRNCHERISLLYPLMEFITTALTILAFIEIKPWYRFLAYLFCFILPVLLLIFIDWREMILPDVITLPGILLGVIFHVADGRGSRLLLLFDSLLGAITGFLTLLLLGILYQKIRHREGMGGGDMKMAAMIGAFFGWKEVFFIFFLASLLGILLGLFLMVIRRHSKETPLPFGSCLGAVSLVHLLWGPPLLTAYLNFFPKIL